MKMAIKLGNEKAHFDLWQQFNNVFIHSYLIHPSLSKYVCTIPYTETPPSSCPYSWYT